MCETDILENKMPEERLSGDELHKLEGTDLSQKTIGLRGALMLRPRPRPGALLHVQPSLPISRRTDGKTGFFPHLVLVPHLVSLVKEIEMLRLPTKETCVLTLSGINSQVKSAISSRIFLNG